MAIWVSSSDATKMTSSNRLKDDKRMRNILLLVDFQEGFLTEETEYLRGPMQALVLAPFFSLVIATRFHLITAISIRAGCGGWRCLYGQDLPNIASSNQPLARSKPKIKVYISQISM
jgi:hypothetical protein